VFVFHRLFDTSTSPVRFNGLGKTDLRSRNLSAASTGRIVLLSRIGRLLWFAQSLRQYSWWLSYWLLGELENFSTLLRQLSTMWNYETFRRFRIVKRPGIVSSSAWAWGAFFMKNRLMSIWVGLSWYLGIGMEGLLWGILKVIGSTVQRPLGKRWNGIGAEFFSPLILELWQEW